MKIAVIIARILLGLGFTIFGLNGFLHFLKAPPPPGLAGEFSNAMNESHFAYLPFGVQFIAGVLLLTNQFVPLALVLLAAELANILAYHLAFQPSTIAPALVMCILWLLVAWHVRNSLRPLFANRTT